MFFCYYDFSINSIIYIHDFVIFSFSIKHKKTNKIQIKFKYNKHSFIFIFSLNTVYAQLSFLP